MPGDVSFGFKASELFFDGTARYANLVGDGFGHHRALVERESTQPFQ
jgi:hypothetical protein